MAKNVQRRSLGRSLRFSSPVFALLATVLIGVAYFIYRGSHAEAIKPQLGGLIDRQGQPSQAMQPVVNGYVVKANWADLQPTQGGAIASDNAIDQAINYVKTQNNAHPGLNMRVKLRIYDGINAPEWAKHLGGPPLTINNTESGTGGTVGRFWTGDFGQAYSSFQAALATKYDGVSEVAEVNIGRCTTVFAEPFLRETDKPANIQAYRDAGYTQAADEGCLHEAVVAHSVWHLTRSSLALNPYQFVTPNDTGVDEAFTESMMVYCRQTLGDRCVLGNNSILSPISSRGANYQSMYDHIKAAGKPIYFQTATLDKVGNLMDTLTWAATQGAGMVELPAGYANSFQPAILTAPDLALETNAVGAIVTPPPPAPPPPPPPGVPVVTMKINGQTGTVTVQPNQAFTVSWLTTADPLDNNCGFSKEGSGSTGQGAAAASPGSQQQTLASGSATYQLSCDIAGITAPILGQVVAKVAGVVGPPPPPPTKDGDVNGDGIVNQADLDLMTAHWLQNYPAADFNHDNIVDAYDLSRLLSRWQG